MCIYGAAVYNVTSYLTTKVDIASDLVGLYRSLITILYPVSCLWILAEAMGVERNSCHLYPQLLKLLVVLLSLARTTISQQGMTTSI